MGIYMGRSLKKASGGRIVKHSGKKRRELSREIVLPIIGEKRVKKVLATGGNVKQKTLRQDSVNVSDPLTGKTFVTKLKTMKENPANPHYVRRNIITKGAVVETEAGSVRITSRPGQSGALSGVLLG